MCFSYSFHCLSIQYRIALLSIKHRKIQSIEANAESRKKNIKKLYCKIFTWYNYIYTRRCGYHRPTCFTNKSIIETNKKKLQPTSPFNPYKAVTSAHWSIMHHTNLILLNLFPCLHSNRFLLCRSVERYTDTYIYLCMQYWKKIWN